MKPDLADILLIGGAALVAAGAWSIAASLGFVVTGVVLFAFGVILALRPSRP